MRFIHTVLTLLMILSVCCIVPATAHPAAEPIVNLEILTAEDVSDIFRAPPIDGSVTQGQTKYYTQYVSVSDTTLDILLTWDRSTGNDLDLIIVPPNAATTYIHDHNDGRVDGKIAVRTGLQQGTSNQWKIGVEGASVTGSQQYTLVINSYA